MVSKFGIVRKQQAQGEPPVWQGRIDIGGKNEVGTRRKVVEAGSRRGAGETFR